MILRTFVIFIVTVSFFVDVKSKSLNNENNLKETCGYQSCHPADPEALNVHLIPHSHDDLGWLKTVDQYYFQDVQTVISSVVRALNQNADRRFVQVEIAYFKRWWEAQPNNTKDIVRNLINTGRLEIINGGWCMNDEANVMYQETIDQYTLGLRFLEDEIGECARPRVAWQIDTFGHSREQASINAQLGFDGIFFMRLDYRDKSKRLNERTADLLWRGSANLGNSSDIFTSIFYDAYSFPSNFCFDHECNDEPIIDDEDSPDYNYQRRVEEFSVFVREKAKMFPTNNLLVVMGDDVRYQAAFMDFLNIDRLIKGFELFPQTYNDQPIKVLYSTPSCYTKAVNDYANNNNFQLDLKTDDFLPYATDGYGYWVGFYTSRPASKRFERQANNLLQSAKQLATYSGESYNNVPITKLKEAVAVMQHHDAITGTEKVAVMKDYHKAIYTGISDTTKQISKILTKLISEDESVSDFEFDSCILRNVSSCKPSKNDAFFVVAYNPLSRKVSAPTNIPVDKPTWKIKDFQGNEVESQVREQIKDFSYIDNVPLAQYELEFIAKDIPPHGFNIYQFESVQNSATKNVQPFDYLVGYENCYFTLDDASGLLKQIYTNGVFMNVSQDIYYYESGSYSGAYIFVPLNNDKIRLATTSRIETTLLFGDVYQGIEQKFNDWTKQVIKVYKDDQSFIEIDWIIGPVDMSDEQGKEFVSVFTTELATNGDFYTDSNGREMLKRTRNFRPTFEYTNEEPVAGNYHPITTRVVLKDEAQQLELAILTDRSQGATSLVDGQVEVMFQRICPHNDFGRTNRGAARDSLNDDEYGQGIVVRGKHYLVAGKSKPQGQKSLAAIQRDVALRKFLEPWTFVSDNNISSGDLKNMQLSGLKFDLPDNVNILTLEPWDDDTLLLRLEHVLEKKEDETLSKEVTVDLTDLFTQFTVIELHETTLGGNMLLEESNRLQWPGSGDTFTGDDILTEGTKVHRDVKDLKITLVPMQIRTFRATIHRN